MGKCLKKNLFWDLVDFFGGMDFRHEGVSGSSWNNHHSKAMTFLHRNYIPTFFQLRKQKYCFDRKLKIFIFFIDIFDFFENFSDFCSIFFSIENRFLFSQLKKSWDIVSMQKSHSFRMVIIPGRSRHSFMAKIHFPWKNLPNLKKDFFFAPKMSQIIDLVFSASRGYSHRS